MTSTIDNPGDSKLMRAARRKAEELGISPSITYRIWKRQSFKHVPEVIRSMPSPQGTKS